MQARLIQAFGSGETEDFTAVAALLAGDVVNLPTGRAGVVVTDVATGRLGSAHVSGMFKVAKTDLIAFLQGGDVYWDVSAAKAHFRPESGSIDFKIGTVYNDALGADAYVHFSLNGRTNYPIDLNGGGDAPDFTVGAVAGTTATVVNLVGGMAQINIAATSEAQGAAVVSNHGVLGSNKPIAEFRVAKYSASGTAIDMDWGIATGSHASDFESITAFAAFHQDGGDDVIDTHSDDNVTDRAPATSGISLVDDTYAEYWLDARDDTNVKFYVDGILVDTAASKRILTAALASSLKLILEVEKTTGTETAELRCSRARMRTQSPVAAAVA